MKPIALGLLAPPTLGGGPAPRAWGAPASPNSYFITEDKIAQSGARTAWDALRLTVPIVQFRERRGRPAEISRRGRASIYLDDRSEEHTSELQSQSNLVCRLLLEKKKKKTTKLPAANR